MEKYGEHTRQELFQKARKACERAYAPYSGFKVGAALLGESGKVYTGLNVENASYGAAICAERTAFVQAISEGEKRFAAIAVASREEEAVPCGICRQFMYEFAPDMDVITCEKGGTLKVRKLKELLPEGFSLKKEPRP